MIPALVAITPDQKQSFSELFSRFFRNCKSPEIRTLREFAEAEIIIPNGPHRGRRFSCRTQPAGGLFLDAVDSRQFSDFVFTAPTQFGKTLMSTVIPIMYHLFEVQEDVIYAVPSMDMAGDKYREDILPVIEASRYSSMIPDTGSGSRGSKKLESVTFTNGVTLKFMSGGGGDAKRSGYTARVVVITEYDKFDEAGDASKESKKINQILARTDSFGDHALTYREGTVSVEQGATWQGITVEGTNSRIACKCPACNDYVTPEREHLVGYEDAESEYHARKNAALCCPSCGTPWSEEQRAQANYDSILLHDGQTIEDGQIVGKRRETTMLGFRATASNNLFFPMAKLAAQEWKRMRAEDEDDANKALCQFKWSLPYQPAVDREIALDMHELAQRMGSTPFGIVPQNCDVITAAVDCHKRFLTYQVVAWTTDGSSVVIEYGNHEIPGDTIGPEQAIIRGLAELDDRFSNGWQDQDGDVHDFDTMWIDAGYHPEAVAKHVRRFPIAEKRRMMCFGRGVTQIDSGGYNQPKTKGGLVKYLGQQFFMLWDKRDRQFHVYINSDWWKTFVHTRLSCAADQPGAMVLHVAKSMNAHLPWAKQILAEVLEVQFKPGTGTVRKWIKKHKLNHYLDVSYMNCAAAHFHGVRMIKTEED